MCNPVAIGLVVAGTALQANAQSRRQNAMQDAAEDARNLELSRQQKLGDEREQALMASQQGMNVEAQNSALEAAAAKREAAYAPAAVAPSDSSSNYNNPASSGTPKIVMEDMEKKRGAASDEAAAVGNARARLGAYSDVNLGNRIANSNSANTIGMLGGFARQSAALLPGEVQAAMQSQAGKGRNQELLGTALAMYGSAGAPGTGGAGSFAGYGSAMGGSANAGATVGGYSGNLSGFTPAAGAAGEAAADAAAPSLLGGMFANGMSAMGSNAPTSGFGGLLNSGYQQAGRAFGALAPTAVTQRRQANRGA